MKTLLILLIPLTLKSQYNEILPAIGYRSTNHNNFSLYYKNIQAKNKHIRFFWKTGFSINISLRRLPALFSSSFGVRMHRFDVCFGPAYIVNIQTRDITIHDGDTTLNWDGADKPHKFAPIGSISYHFSNLFASIIYCNKLWIAETGVNIKF